MNEETAVVTVDEVVPQPPRSLIVGNLDLESYQRQVFLEAQERVRLREQAVAVVEAEVAEAVDGVEAAQDANILDQQHKWMERLSNRRNVLTRRRKSLEAGRKFLELVTAGYLPIPRLEAGNVHWLRDRMPPEALRTIARENEHGLFSEFRVAEPWRFTRRGPRRIAGRDPILVGLCDGEMFALAWWR